MTFFNALTLEFELPFDRSDEVVMRVRVDLGGCEPLEVVRALDLLYRLDEPESIALELDGEEAARLLPHGPEASVVGDRHEVWQMQLDVARDLAVVQDATATYFEYPAEVFPSDRVYLRCLRLLLEGHCVVLPKTEVLFKSVPSRDREQVRALLEHGSPPIAGEIEGFGIEVFGRTFDLGTARTYVPAIKILVVNDALAALDDLERPDIPITLRTPNGFGYWTYLVDRFRPGPDDVLRPAGLGLAGYVDAPDVSRAQVCATKP